MELVTRNNTEYCEYTPQELDEVRLQRDIDTMLTSEQQRQEISNLFQVHSTTNGMTKHHTGGQ